MRDQVSVQKDLLLVRSGMFPFLGLMFARSASSDDLLCYMENSSGEAVNLAKPFREMQGDIVAQICIKFA